MKTEKQIRKEKIDKIEISPALRDQLMHDDSILFADKINEIIDYINSKE